MPLTITTRALLTQSLQVIGAVAQGETPDDADLEDALSVFQMMVDAWAAERLTIYLSASDDYPIVAGVSDYTIGPSGDFDQVRPLWIDGMNLVVPGAGGPPPAEYSMELLTLGQWQRIVLKRLQSAYPRQAYYEFTFPVGTLHIYPVPNQSALQLRIWTPRPIEAALALDDDIALPPGYPKALKYCLARELSEPWGQALTPTVQALATEGLAIIKRANRRIEYMLFDPALVVRGGRYNIYTDGYRTW